MTVFDRREALIASTNYLLAHGKDCTEGRKRPWAARLGLNTRAQLGLNDQNKWQLQAAARTLASSPRTQQTGHAQQPDTSRCAAS